MKNKGSELFGFDYKAFFEEHKSIIYFIVIGLVLIFLYRRFVKGVQTPQPPGNLTNTPVEKEDDSKSGITEQEARAYAERLYEAMKGIGTDEEAIKKILQPLTLHDYNRVYNMFGLRKYFVNGEAAFLGENLSLTEWLIQELSDNDIIELKKLNRNLPL